MLCRCPYKEEIVRQTTIARTPNHQSVDDCRLALPPRLWQLHNPEGRGGNCDRGQPHIPTLILSVTAGCSFTSYPGPISITTFRTKKKAPYITKTRLYNFDLLKPHFYIVKLGFTGVYIFLFLLKNIDCGYFLEPPRRETIYVLSARRF